jgi:hypothetical protein
MSIVVGVGDLVQRIGDGRTDRVLGGRATERSGDAVCGIDCARGRREMWVSWLSLKIKVYGLSVVWPQKHWDGFLRFGLKTSGDGFLWFDLKTSGSGFPIWVSKPATIV